MKPIVLVTQNRTLYPMLSELVNGLAKKEWSLSSYSDFSFIDRMLVDEALVIIDFDTVELPSHLSWLPSNDAYKCLAINLSLNDHQTLDFLNTGFKGVISSPSLFEHFKKAVLNIFNGQLWFSRPVLSMALQESNSQRLSCEEKFKKIAVKFNLTTKELITLKMVLKGLTNQDIADNQHVSVNTIKTHLSKVFQKLSVHSRKELIDHIDKL